MLERSLFRLVLVFTLCVLGSVSALAQQYPPGGGGSTSPTGTSTGSYGSGAAIGIGVAAAAGATIAFLALHKTSVIGCVEPSSEGLKLLNERDKKTYGVVAGSEDLKAGDRVELRGKRTKDNSGKLTFHAQKLVKDYGPCDRSGRESATTTRP